MSQLVASLLFAALAQGAEPMRLKVGRPVDWTPGYPSVQIVCDDLTVVRVEDAGDHLRLHGLKPGTTLCAFWRDRGHRRTLEITVER